MIKKDITVYYPCKLSANASIKTVASLRLAATAASTASAVAAMKQSEI
jgi:hypothetical protein